MPISKRVFIIHGWAVTGRSSWFPWLTKELESRGFFVEVPDMPTPIKPKIWEWLQTINDSVGVPNQNTFFVGHSLGVSIILRYLESLNTETRIGGTVLVAGVVKAVHSRLPEFLDRNFDYKKIKNICPKFTAIYAEDDSKIPFGVHSKSAVELLGAKLVTIPVGGHLTATPNASSLNERDSSVDSKGLPQASSPRQSSGHAGQDPQFDYSIILKEVLEIATG